MTHALADDVHHAIFLLCQCNENDNIQKRPDICALRTLVHGAILQSSFSAHSGTAVFLWALREEVYIDAWMAALSAGGSIKDCKDAVMAVPKAPYAHDQSWPAGGSTFIEVRVQAVRLKLRPRPAVRLTLAL